MRTLEVRRLGVMPYGTALDRPASELLHDPNLNRLFLGGQVLQELLRDNYAEAHNNLGTTLLRQGQTEEAIRQFQEAIRLKPDDADARYNLEAIRLWTRQMREVWRQRDAQKRRQ